MKIQSKNKYGPMDIIDEESHEDINLSYSKLP